MKANCWVRPLKVEVQNVPDPSILNGRDAIIRITSSAICGSDLHMLDGYIPTMQKGDVLGHEFMGEVVETGKDIDPGKLKAGDRVVVPFRSRAGRVPPARPACTRYARTPTRTPGWPRSSSATRPRESSATPI